MFWPYSRVKVTLGPREKVTFVLIKDKIYHKKNKCFQVSHV